MMFNNQSQSQSYIAIRTGRLVISCSIVVLFSIGVPVSLYAASIDGLINWNRRVELTTTVSGIVKDVMVTEGSLVTRNQILIKLEGTAFNARLKLANAEYSKAAHVYKEAKKQLARQKELFDRTVISVHDLELSKISHTQALANLKQAQAKVSLARFNQAQSILRAPFDAVVIAMLVQQGSVISTRLQAQPMLVLAERGKMKVVAQVTLAVIKVLKSGQDVKIVVNDKEYSGQISTLGYEPVKLGRRAKPVYRISVVFDLPGFQLLRVGQRAYIKY